MTHAAALRVLSDGKVQIIGGEEAGSMEMFNPMTERFTAFARLDEDSDSLRALRSSGRAAIIREREPVPGPDAAGADESSITLGQVTERSGHTLSEIPGIGALVTGGVRGFQILSTAAVIQSSGAEVTTNQTDYYPGETVVINGSGFLPGEQITLVLEVQKDGVKIQNDIILHSQADENGNFQNSDLVVDSSHLGATFLLTATGETSGYTAQTTFTDSPKIGSVGVGAQTGIVTAGTAGSVAYGITVTRGNSQAGFSANLSVTAKTLPLAS